MVNKGFSFFLNRTRDPGCTPHHRHDCYELVFYTNAEGTTYIGDEEFSIGANQIALIPTNVSHTDHYLRPSQVYCIGFFSDSNIEPMVITDENGELLLFFEEIEKELKRNANHSNEIINRCVDIILFKLLRYNQLPDTDSNTHQRLGYTAQYIKSNFSTNIDFQKLAASIGYSHDHFRHMFTEAYGCSPKQLMINTRIEHAKYLLRNTNDKIKKIAMDCGYRQSAQFVAAFGKYVGMSPAVYRSRVKVDFKEDE